MSLVAAVVCAPLLILGSALVFLLLVMIDRPDQPAGGRTGQPVEDLRRAA